MTVPSPTEEPMGFEEAMTRARAAHVVVREFTQPGNGYKLEYECRCRAWVWATGWEAHVLAAADAIREGRELKPTMHGLSV